jgi:type IV secretory pathway TraG/TraD family ATPase VirD4
MVKNNGTILEQNGIPPLPPLPSMQNLDPNILGMMVTMGALGFILLVKAFLDRRKSNKDPKLGRARKATKTEWQKSQEQARNNIINYHRKKNFSKFGGWVGKPKTVLNYGRFFGVSEADIFLDRLNEHMLLLASAGSGKSYSVFDPLARSLIDQFFSLGIFDFKGDEEDDDTCCPSSALAGYALERGYSVYTIAPGYADSDRMNLLDYVHDASSAGELADVLYANINKGKDSNSDDFFPLAGKLVLQGVFLVCKHQPEGGVADLALCHKILSLPNLLERIQHADLPQYIKVVFDQLISTAGSPETAASIIATAQAIFTKFQIDPAWATFCGKSTMPILLGEKELVIYRLNPLYEKTLAPLMAAVIHLQARANTYGKRSTKYPFCMLLDEFPRILLPGLAQEMAVARSKKVAYILAAQGISTMEETYGKLGTEAIMANAKTVFVGQLNCERTIKHYAESFGKEDIKYETFSDSKQRGALFGGNSSENNNLTTRELIPGNELKEAPQGMFYMRSPGTKGKIEGQARSQMLWKVLIAPRDREVREAQAAQAAWFRYRNRRIRSPVAITFSERQLKARESYANVFLPMPPSNKKLAFKKLIA